MESYTIISVKIVSGTELNQGWDNDMQIVKTDKGEFIDNIPNYQFGDWTRGKKATIGHKKSVNP